MKILPGDLIVISGKVGSGKTTKLQAVLSDLKNSGFSIYPMPDNSSKMSKNTVYYWDDIPTELSLETLFLAAQNSNAILVVTVQTNTSAKINLDMAIYGIRTPMTSPLYSEQAFTEIKSETTFH